jgi:spore coat polysaccharide biosynthesis protein SpsF
MKIVAIIQARLTSMRFPAKIMQKIGEKTVLQHVIDAVNDSGIRHVVVASPHFIEFDYADRFVGSEHDVLDRYYFCAKKWNADIVVRITSDCPLLTAKEINQALDIFEQYDFPYIIYAPVDGLDVEVFTYGLLREAYEQAIEPYDREHVTPYMRRVTKLSLDIKADLERIKEWAIGKGRRK